MNECASRTHYLNGNKAKTVLQRAELGGLARCFTHTPRNDERQGPKG
jgi:hypothetical protein